MSLSVNSQEIYLLERYISRDYFRVLQETWTSMVSHVDSCLASYLAAPPENDRSPGLHARPDIAWGRHVLPQLRDTLEGLHTGGLLLQQGDFKGLGYAWGPRSDFRTLVECWSGWMKHEDEHRYGVLLNQALSLARNICTTEGAYWEPGELAQASADWETLDAPAQWPGYGVNRQVSVIAGQEVRHAGIYVPNVDDSCAQFLGTRTAAPSARVLVGVKEIPNLVTGETYSEERMFEERSCVWYLVERTPDLNEALQAERPDIAHGARLALGEKCRQIRLYFSAAGGDEQGLCSLASPLPGQRLACGGA